MAGDRWHQGIISGLVTESGFGFIRDDEGPDDAVEERYFHVTACKGGDRAFRKLLVGDRVRYTMFDTPRGPKAGKVGRI